MSATSPRDAEAPPAGANRPVMPPHLVLRDFLKADVVASLLDFTLAHESAFEPTKVGRGKAGGVNPQTRISVGTHNLGSFKAMLTQKLHALAPELVARLRMTPVNDAEVELELVAHNDGAFYRRHIDTQTASDHERIRVLSGVYYFHAHPKSFTGGALRLYAIGDRQMRAFADIDPEHNALLVFPSWAPHEVMPVSCPSKRFADSRFAINCWVRRKRSDAAAPNTNK